MAFIQLSSSQYTDFAAYKDELYESVLQGVEAGSAKVLESGATRLAQAVRHAADRSTDPLAPARIADAWLSAHLGHPNDPLRRAAVAALALKLQPEAGLLPQGVLELYPAMHMRLARFLKGSHVYNADLFAKDMALAAGASAPIGPLTIAIPSPHAPRLTAARAKRAVAGFRRQLQQQGLGEACEWLSLWGIQSWVELHVDTRNLSEFNEAGFYRCYHRLADLMELRPDLAGVYGASWIYQPEIATISPNLAFGRETAEATGGRLVRLRADPVQTAYALARSPTRRRLYMSGEYKPVCHGMFWTRQALIDWSRADRAKSQGAGL
jgi:hypothetical protein